MEYANIKRAGFISRPNRFIAEIEINGERAQAHVKNTGRCKELLLPGAVVFVDENHSPGRKTRYDLISVFKGENLINMDSNAPNKVFAQWAAEGGLLGGPVDLIKPEVKLGGSRLDFYVEAGKRKAFVEVKGVTLEDGGVAMFPDAPTERGVKHIKELCGALENGFEAYAVFVIQMKGVKLFRPNDVTHKAFGDALRKASAMGVNILAMDCVVTESGIVMGEAVEVELYTKPPLK